MEVVQIKKNRISAALDKSEINAQENEFSITSELPFCHEYQTSRNAYAQSVALPNYFTLQKTWFKSATKQESRFLLR